MGQIIYKEHVVFRGSNVTCRLAFEWRAYSLRLSFFHFHCILSLFSRLSLLVSLRIHLFASFFLSPFLLPLISVAESTLLLPKLFFVLTFGLRGSLSVAKVVAILCSVTIKYTTVYIADDITVKQTMTRVD